MVFPLAPGGLGVLNCGVVLIRGDLCSVSFVSRLWWCVVRDLRTLGPWVVCGGGNCMLRMIGLYRP